MNKATATSLAVISLSLGIFYYTYDTMIKMGFDTEVQDPSQGVLNRIELLEIGINNHMETIKDCDETLAYNRKQFDAYVERTEEFTSQENLELDVLEAELLRAQVNADRQKRDNKRLLAAIEDRNDRIAELQEYIRELQQ